MNEWSEEERKAIESLPREVAPPAELERRILAELRMRGVVRRWWTRVASAAAVLAIGFAVGFASSRFGTSDTPVTPRYLLLLRESPSATTRTQVEEYVAWAQEAREGGTLLSGEKLTDHGRLIRPGEPVADEDFTRAGEVGGFFLITAPDLDSATRVAQSTPHLRYGGTVELRPIHDMR